MSLDIRSLVADAAGRASGATRAMARASDEQIAKVLSHAASRLGSEASAVLAANRQDMQDANGALSPGGLDRLRLDEIRLASMARQVRALAALPPLEAQVSHRFLDNGLELEERRIPVGVIGANYEARPNVTVDFATQLVKSRNAGVLRTGGASLGSAIALVDRVISPALEDAGLPAETIQLVRSPDREAAEVLVSLPRAIPLVILRGSGEITARLARLATERGVRTLAHAEGGGVLYVDAQADTGMALRLVEVSLDRLGVCNRLNLLLIDATVWNTFLPQVLTLLASLRIEASLPPHSHPLGYEWANDAGRDATVTVASVAGPEEAAQVANDNTSGLAGAIVTNDPESAEEFTNSYRGTGVFVNATTRWLDGFELTAAPETGINVDRVPGPRGPVTYRDLYLRQYLIRGNGTQHR